MTGVLHRVWTHADFATTSPEDVDGFASGTVRVWNLEGVFLPFVKLPCGRWRPLPRKVPGHVLSRFPSAERVALADQRSASRVAAMQRVAKASGT